MAAGTEKSGGIKSPGFLLSDSFLNTDVFNFKVSLKIMLFL
jgi:hypothetical protein